MSRGWTRQDVTRHELKQQATHSKFHNIKKTVHGITFDSTKESLRYLDLTILQAAGEIADLAVQPQFELIASNGEVCGRYFADFSYLEKRTGERIVEDVKSEATRTALYKLKKRWVQACHGVIIREV